MKTRAIALTFVTRLFVSASASSVWSTIYSPKEQFSGHSVALNDDLLVVGGPYTSKEGDANNAGGLVRIYSKSEKKLDLFHEVYGHPNDSLGYAIDVAANSKTVVMGAPRSDASGDARGYVMVMHFNEWKNKWEELGSLITGTIDGGNFGESVAISDDGLIIAAGSKGDGLRLGLVKVYMYEEVSNQWMQVGDHLNGHDVHEEFGLSLDLVGDIQKYYLAMGAPNYKSGRGLVQGYYYDDDLGWMDFGGDITGMHMEDRCGADISLAMKENYLYLAVGTPTTEYYAGEEIGERGTEGHVQVYRYDTNDEDGLWEEFGDEIEEGMEDDKVRLRNRIAFHSHLKRERLLTIFPIFQRLVRPLHYRGTAEGLSSDHPNTMNLEEWFVYLIIATINLNIAWSENTLRVKGPTISVLRLQYLEMKLLSELNMEITSIFMLLEKPRVQSLMASFYSASLDYWVWLFLLE